MAIFSGPTQAIGQPDFVSQATAAHPLGTRIESQDGRVFRYVKAGAALVAGTCVQSPAIVPNHLANTPPIVAAGAKSFVYTPGATLGAADLYADGLMQVDTAPGPGYSYTVDGHAAFASGTAFTLNLKDPLQVAISATSRVGLMQNKYKGVIQMPITTATGVLVGVSTYVIASGEWGWIQTWGLCSVLTAGTPALGAIVMAPGAVAGAASVVVAAGNLIVAQIVGQMAQVGVDTKYNWIDLKIQA
jgi:hypothetical protein